MRAGFVRALRRKRLGPRRAAKAPTCVTGGSFIVWAHVSGMAFYGQVAHSLVLVCAFRSDLGPGVRSQRIAHLCNHGRRNHDPPELDEAAQSA